VKLGIDVSATTIATVLRLGGLGPAPPSGRAHLDTVPAAPGVRPALSQPQFDEEDGLEDLASPPHREAPGPVGAYPATTDHDESIHDDPARPHGRPIDAVGDRPGASVTTVPPRVGTRARDGPAVAA